MKIQNFLTNFKLSLFGAFFGERLFNQKKEKKSESYARKIPEAQNSNRFHYLSFTFFNNLIPIMKKITEAVKPKKKSSLVTLPVMLGIKNPITAEPKNSCPKVMKILEIDLSWDSLGCFLPKIKGGKEMCFLYLGTRPY